MQISKLMSGRVDVIEATTPVQEVARAMAKDDVGCIPVSENDRLIGIVTDRDIVVRGLATGADLSGKTARDVMSSGVCYCYEDQSVDEVLENMGEIKVRRLVVLDRDKNLVGIVSLGDIAGRAPAGSVNAALASVTTDE